MTRISSTTITRALSAAYAKFSKPIPTSEATEISQRLEQEAFACQEQRPRHQTDSERHDELRGGEASEEGGKRANPYSSLPEKAFWKTAVAQRHPMSIADLWTPKFRVGPDDLVATMGSCFAQHFGKALAKRGYKWFDAEPAPPGINEVVKKRFNYGVFSARTANIYTARSFFQWVRWALELEEVPPEIWFDGARVFDPFRPTIEPGGFASEDEMLRSRQVVLSAFRNLIEKSRVFVFTMGLTEAWLNRDGGYVYPMCPGTTAGTFDHSLYEFKNFTYPEIEADMAATIDAMRTVNPELKALLTVSPVPLTATASGDHILVAASYSKSVLRAVAGHLAATLPGVDYFPSYEIITSVPYRSMFFEQNLRSVASVGVDHVMDTFFTCNGGADENKVQKAAAKPASVEQAPNRGAKSDEDDVVCEEELLAAFSKGAKA